MPQEAGVTEVLANLSISYIVLAAFILTMIRMILLPSKSPVARSVAELVESLIIAGVLVFMIIRPFFLQAFFIPSESMEPTLQGHEAGYQAGTGTNYKDRVHDHIFVNKLVYRYSDPKPGDIIVFRAPKEADMSYHEEGRAQQENVLIKRLIAVGGQTIEVRRIDDDGNARIFVDGQPRDEANIKFLEPMQDVGQASFQLPGAPFAVNQPLKLAPDQLFVMGDNRNHSNDSRFWGPLKRDRVIGKAMFIFWPLNRIRIIR